MKGRHWLVIVGVAALAWVLVWYSKRGGSDSSRAREVTLREFSEIELGETKDGCQVVDKTTRHKAKPGGTTHWRVRNNCNSQQNVRFADWKFKVIVAENTPCSWQDTDAILSPAPFPPSCDLGLSVPAGQTRQLPCNNNKSGADKGCHPYRIHLNGAPQPDPELVIWP